MRAPLGIAVGLLIGCPISTAFRTSLGDRDKSPGQIRQEQDASRALSKSEEPPLTSVYSAHNLSVPVDHFHNESKYEPHSNATFDLRYWFDAQYYKPGGPVVVLQSGESKGTKRLPFLRKGIVHELAKATHGIGVILEHRYYGTSFPVPDLSVESLRFLTTEQAMADQAYFAQHIKFPGLEKYGDLTSSTTPYIAYGGSYAGAFVAFLRKTYPNVYWGAVSSSGVTKAVWDYWAYFKPIAEYGPPECIQTQQTLISIVDGIIIGNEDKALTAQLKQTFGLGNLTYTNDFANTLSNGVEFWQSLNWDPAVSEPEFFNYCDNITSTKTQYPGTEKLRENVTDLIQRSGHEADQKTVNQMLNYIGYINLTAVAPCAASNQTLDQCYSQNDPSFYKQDALNQTWRSWPWQYCTEFGYLQTGSGVPKGQLPLISHAIDLEYLSTVCRDAFNITKPADVEIINKYGGYDIRYPRLAIIDGDRDPWKEVTPHGFDFGAKQRGSTTSEPFILIENAIHHYDENGLFPNETTPELPPKPIVETQRQEVEFVKAWIAEYYQEHPTHTSL